MASVGYEWNVLKLLGRVYAESIYTWWCVSFLVDRGEMGLQRKWSETGALRAWFLKLLSSYSDVLAKWIYKKVCKFKNIHENDVADNFLLLFNIGWGTLLFLYLSYCSSFSLCKTCFWNLKVDGSVYFIRAFQMVGGCKDEGVNTTPNSKRLDPMGEGLMWWWWLALVSLMVLFQMPSSSTEMGIVEYNRHREILNFVIVHWV